MVIWSLTLGLGRLSCITTPSDRVRTVSIVATKLIPAPPRKVIVMFGFTALRSTLIATDLSPGMGPVR